MSVSILYHGFGLRNVVLQKTEFIRGKIYFSIWLKQKICSHCQSHRTIQKGVKVRRLKTTPIGVKPVWLKLHLRRLLCAECGRIAQESYHPIADPKKQYTRHLARFVTSLKGLMTVEDIARLVGLHWNTVWEILSKQYRKQMPTAKQLRTLRRIGIDELAIAKGQSYMTIVVDHDSGQVVHAALGRKSDSVVGFLKRLRRLKAPIEVVTTDMWPAYISAIVENLPDSRIVFDKFHIIQNLNKAIDEVRRNEYRAMEKTSAKILKGSRYLLLKHPQRLSDNAREQLQQILAINTPLSICYTLKEQLHEFWNYTSAKEASRFLKRWCEMAFKSGLGPMQKFANTLLSHRSAITNYFDHPLTNGKVEGLINKIKVLKRQAYGYRNWNHFILRLFSIHQTRYSLL